MRSPSLSRLLVAGLLAAGCAREVPSSPQPLVVGAPTALKEAFDRAAARFRARHPQIGVTVLYGAPSQLADSGVALDAIAAESGDQLAGLSGRLLEPERRAFAANPLVLVTRPATQSARLKTLADDPAVKTLAIGDGRSDPSGQAAEAALGRLGLRAPLRDKLRYVASGDMVLEQVARGDLDAGLALAADAAAYNVAHGAPLVVADSVDDAHTRLAIAPLKGTPRIQAARDFIEELQHGEAQKLLADRHYLPVKE